jgi:hypothetical protein
VIKKTKVNKSKQKGGGKENKWQKFFYIFSIFAIRKRKDKK